MAPWKASQVYHTIAKEEKPAVQTIRTIAEPKYCKVALHCADIESSFVLFSLFRFKFCMWPLLDFLYMNFVPLPFSFGRYSPKIPQRSAPSFSIAARDKFCLLLFRCIGYHFFPYIYICNQ